METTPEQAIATLLRETQAAHRAYEKGVLGGEFDEDWAAWYATYLLDHGLADYLAGAGNLDAETLTAMLTRLDAEYRQEETTGHWPDIYARGIVAGFR